MKKNERNAGRKLKFGVPVKTLQIKVPAQFAEEIKGMFYKLLETYKK